MPSAGVCGAAVRDVAVLSQRSYSRYDTFRAQGYGGQLIYVIPELDLVAIITSDPDQERNDAGNLVWPTIVPAVTG
jgi:hypothetical protein